MCHVHKYYVSRHTDKTPTPRVCILSHVTREPYGDTYEWPNSQTDSDAMKDHNVISDYRVAKTHRIP